MNSITLSENDVSRFWLQVKVGNPNECWEWQGTKIKDGYGRFTQKNKKLLSNRVAWSITNGNIPKGLLVCHVCDNPSCCNPGHLFLGTHKDNSIDMVKKGRCGKRNNRGERHGLSKLTEKEIIQIRELGKTRKNVEISKIFNVHPATIGKIVRKKLWYWL